MSLIEQIRNAVDESHLKQPFTVNDLKEWVSKKDIVKCNGDKYSESSIDAILANSDIKNIPTSNKNSKVLCSQPNKKGIKEYWFL